MIFFRDCFCEIWVKFGFQNKNKGNLGIICRTSNGNNASFSYSISDGPLPKRGFGLITISKSMIWKSYQTAKKKKKMLNQTSTKSRFNLVQPWVNWIFEEKNTPKILIGAQIWFFVFRLWLFDFFPHFIYIKYFFLVVVGVRGSRRTWLILECVVL